MNNIYTLAVNYRDENLVEITVSGIKYATSLIESLSSRMSKNPQIASISGTSELTFHINGVSANQRVPGSLVFNGDKSNFVSRALLCALESRFCESPTLMLRKGSIPILLEYSAPVEKKYIISGDDNRYVKAMEYTAGSMDEAIRMAALLMDAYGCTDELEKDSLRNTPWCGGICFVINKVGQFVFSQHKLGMVHDLCIYNRDNNGTSVPRNAYSAVQEAARNTIRKGGLSALVDVADTPKDHALFKAAVSSLERGRCERKQ